MLDIRSIYRKFLTLIKFFASVVAPLSITPHNKTPTMIKPLINSECILLETNMCLVAAKFKVKVLIQKVIPTGLQIANIKPRRIPLVLDTDVGEYK